MPVIAASISNPNPAITSTALPFPTPFLILLTIFNVLYLLGPPIFSWRFPCQTTDDLDIVIVNLEKLINANCCLKRDLIGLDVAEGFKSTLQRLSDTAFEIKLLPEPPRTNPFIWFMFRWKVVRDVDACYTSLKALECEVKAKIHA